MPSVEGNTLLKVLEQLLHKIKAMRRRVLVLSMCTRREVVGHWVTVSKPGIMTHVRNMSVRTKSRFIIWQNGHIRKTWWFEIFIISIVIMNCTINKASNEWDFSCTLLVFSNKNPLASNHHYWVNYHPTGNIDTTGTAIPVYNPDSDSDPAPNASCVCIDVDGFMVAVMVMM